MKLILLLLLPLHAIAFDHSHSKWGQVLSTHLKTGPISTRLDYSALKKNDSKLKQYLGELEALKVKEFQDFTPQEKLSFWINAYNAYTVKLILNHYPVTSIKEIKPKGIFSFFSNPWKIEFIPLLEKKLTLDQIEHEIIRKEFKEARIHFAVNCASMGCPSLFHEAFQATKLDDQLSKVSKNFINNTNKNSIDWKDRTIFYSKIFQWYGDDFKKQYGSFQNFFILNHKRGSEIKNFKEKWSEYDWKLNH